MNLLNEVDKPIVKKTIVVYAGRFQPFHRGHYASYKKLVSKFGADNVYIGTSNDTSGPKSPFNFNEKKKIATTMFGIPANRFVNISNPYKPVEILQKFDGQTTQYIAAVGEKDATRLSGKYFKRYQGKAGYGYDEIGYVYPVPAEADPISGTEVRKGLGSGTDKEKERFFLRAYPKMNKDIFKMITDKMAKLNEAGPLKGTGHAGSFGPNPFSIKDDESDEDMNEDGFPGGVFTGLVSPGGYINGAPKPKDVAKMRKKLDKERNESTNNGVISKSKVKNIVDFVGYATNRLKLKTKPNVKLILGQTYSQEHSTLGGYSPDTKDILVVVPHRMTADICRTIAHELVHRKQDEMGYIKDRNTAGATGSPIENQANSVAGILLRDYGKINKTIYSEGKIISEVSIMSTDGDDQPNGAFLPKGAKRKLGSDDGVNKSDYWFHNGGYIQLEFPEADTILGDEDQNQIYVKYITKNVPRQTGPTTKFTTNPEKAKVISEMSKNDIHFKNVFDHWRDGDAKMKQKIAKIVTGNPYAKAKEIVKDLLELGHKEIEEIEDEIGIPIRESINETIKKVGKKYVVYPKNGGKRFGTHDSLSSAKKQLAAIEINKEDINVDVNTGDEVLMGKFKNKKVQVKNIGKDQHGMPTINGKQATTFRTINEKTLLDKWIESYIDNYIKEGNFAATSFGEDGSFRSPYMKKWEDWDKSGEALARIVGFEVKGHTSDSFKEKREGKVLPTNNPTEENGPGKRWIHPFKPKEYAEDKKTKWEMYPFNSRPDAYQPPPDIGTQVDIFKYDKPSVIKENIQEWNQLLLEGGAYGHMSHPFDDMDLTFGQLKDIITKALDGDLGVVREKTDGQALAISWKGGRLIAARNKGHLQNAGANAMGINDVASKFAGRGGLTDAYNFAMQDLNAAIAGLSEKQRQKIFNEGKCFMNLEVIWPTSVNVIPYGQALLVFHNTTCYDEAGKAIGADQSAARTLAGMIKQVNADVQSKYTIQGPPVTEIPKTQELSSLKSGYLSKLSKLQNEFGCNDSDTMVVYHQHWWENFITKNSPVKVDKLTMESLVRRWAFGDKSFRLNTISNPELQKWATEHDKVNVQKQQKDNMRQFEEIFLGVGADVLSFVSSVLTVHPDKAIRNMKDRLKSTASQVRKAGNPTQIQKLKTELERLNSLGGMDKIVPNEGIVFFYGGKTYKLTGTFAPLNQILGIFYE